MSHTIQGPYIYGVGNRTIEIVNNTCSDASGNGIDLYRNQSVVVEGES